jgi:hypothetical protein
VEIIFGGVKERRVRLCSGCVDVIASQRIGAAVKERTKKLKKGRESRRDVQGGNPHSGLKPNRPAIIQVLFRPGAASAGSAARSSYSVANQSVEHASGEIKGRWLYC